MSSYLRANKCFSFDLNINKENDCITLNRDSFQSKIFYNYSEKNMTFNKNYSIGSRTGDSNLYRQSFSLNRENDNKSAYSNYIKLNKSQYYYNGNEIGNCSSYKINNSWPPEWGAGSAA